MTKLDRFATALNRGMTKVLVALILVPFTVVLSVKMVSEWARKRREQRMVLRELKRQGLGWLPMALSTPRMKARCWRVGRNG